jgi:hypothetical protein
MEKQKKKEMPRIAVLLDKETKYKFAMKCCKIKKSHQEVLESFVKEFLGGR